MSGFQTSSNGTAWTRNTLIGSLTETIISCAFDGTSRWIFATSTGRTFYSTDDGATWTEGGTLNGDGFSVCKIYYSAAVSLWIGLADDAINTSTDGTTWTLRRATGNDQMYDVVDDGTTVVAVGQDGRIYTSTNGTTWTLRTPGSSYGGDFRYIIFEESLFVAAGEIGGGDDLVIQTSPDGTTWTQRLTTSGSFVGEPVGLIYDGSDFICYIQSSGAGDTYTSADGLTWSADNAPNFVQYGGAPDWDTFPFYPHYVDYGIYDEGGPDEQWIAMSYPGPSDDDIIYRSVDGFSFSRTGMSNPAGFEPFLTGIYVHK